MRDPGTAPPKIFVTTDGSDKDQRAIAIAAALAELADADARVIRVFPTPISRLSAKAGTLGVVTAAHELRDRAEEDGRDAGACLRALVKREVTADIVDGTDVAAALLDEIDRHNPEFVVTATRAA